MTISVQGTQVVVTVAGKKVPLQRIATSQSTAQVPASPPRLGVQVAPIDLTLAAHLGLPENGVLTIEGVTAGSPASRANLRVDDLMLAVDGASPVTLDVLQSKLAQKKPGDTIALRLQRRTETFDVAVTLDSAPAGGGRSGGGMAGVPSSPRSMLGGTAQADRTTEWLRSNGYDAASKSLAEALESVSKEKRQFAALRDEVALLSKRIADETAKLEIGKLDAQLRDWRSASDAESKVQEALRALQGARYLRSNLNAADGARSMSPMPSMPSAQPAPPAPPAPAAPSARGSASAQPRPGTTGQGGPANSIGRHSPLVVTQAAPAPDLRPDLERIERRLARLEEMLETYLKGEKKDR